MRRRSSLQIRLFILFIVVPTVLFFPSGKTLAQVQLNINEAIDLRFGILLQAQADWTENPAAETYTQNLFLRRVKFFVDGRITPNLSFVYSTDHPNLGKATTNATAANPSNKRLSNGMITQDAFLTWRIADPLAFDVGLMLVPLCRNCLEKTSTLLPVDSGAYILANSEATQSVVGRDTGAQARGYLFGNRLEYRAGLFQGNRTEVNNPLRFAGRLQFSFLDPMIGFFYTGTYLGTEKVLALGVSYDAQKDYRAYGADFFIDRPWGPGAVKLQIDYLMFDGGSFLPTLPEQRDWLVQAGYYLSEVKWMPWLKAEERRVSGNNDLNERRYQVGLTYYLSAHQLNIKGAYGKINPETGESADQFTIQLQAFYF